MTEMSLAQRDQIIYTRSFALELEAAGADFISPVEGFYKIKMLKADRHLEYDLVLRSEDKAFEMRFDVKPDYQLAVPHIHCFNLLNSIAVNEEHFDIELNLFSPEESQKRYHADWSAYADFVPKRRFSDFHYGRLVTIYREDRGLIHQILLFNEHNREKDLRMHTISFKEAH
ncbi:MAG: hypothetical protein KTR24_14635 [Saprospiraceae bacterium]|nr:hypothetical protein [Saprospiraceae bacterium]